MVLLPMVTVDFMQPTGKFLGTLDCRHAEHLNHLNAALGRPPFTFGIIDFAGWV
jgi:hypothetical protein